MAAIVYQTNKKTGTIYAYESISYWDKKKQMPAVGRKKKRGPVRVISATRPRIFSTASVRIPAS